MKYLFPALLFLSVILVSGCATYISYDNALALSNEITSEYRVYYSGMAKTVSRNILNDNYTINTLKTGYCPVYQNANDTRFYDVIYSECDFAKLRTLKDKDNYSDQFIYLSMAGGSSVHRIFEAANSTLQEKYDNERTETTEQALENIFNKGADVILMVNLLNALGRAYQDMSTYLQECNTSSECIRTRMDKLSADTDQLIQKVAFGSNFLNNCEGSYKKDWAYYNTVASLTEKFSKKGAAIDVESRLTPKLICSRMADIYYGTFTNTLPKQEDPLARYFIASAFSYLLDISSIQNN